MTTEREKIIQLASKYCGVSFPHLVFTPTALVDFYKAAQAEAFEAAAKLCDENACDYTREGALVCAAAIREMAKEKQNATGA